MNDLKDYIEERKKRSPEFAEGYDEGYELFKKNLCKDQIENKEVYLNYGGNETENPDHLR